MSFDVKVVPAIRTVACLSLAVAFIGVPVAAQEAADSYVSVGSVTWSDPSPRPGDTVTIAGVVAANTRVDVAAHLAPGTTLNVGSTFSDDQGNHQLSFTLPATETIELVTVTTDDRLISSTPIVAPATDEQVSAPTNSPTPPATSNTLTSNTLTSDMLTSNTLTMVLVSISATLVAGAGLLLTVARRMPTRMAVATGRRA